MLAVIPDTSMTLSVTLTDPSTGEPISAGSASWEVLGTSLSGSTFSLVGGVAQVAATWSGLAKRTRYTLKVSASGYPEWRFPLYATARIFHMPLVAAQFESRYPHLSELLPSGTTIQGMLSEVWSDLVLKLEARVGEYPGDLWHASRFRRHLELETVARIHERAALGRDSEDLFLSDRYRKQANAAFDMAVEGLESDSDANEAYSILDSKKSLRGVELTR